MKPGELFDALILEAEKSNKVRVTELKIVGPRVMYRFQQRHGTNWEQMSCRLEELATSDVNPEQYAKTLIPKFETLVS